MNNKLTSSILEKISDLAEADLKVNVEILTSVRKTNEILSQQVYNELKVQTGILKQLHEAINKSGNNYSFNLFGSSTQKNTKLLTDFFTKSDSKSIDKVAKSITTLSESISLLAESINSIDSQKLTDLSEGLISISKGIGWFALTIALAAPAMIIGTLVTLPALVLWYMALNIFAQNSASMLEASRALFFAGLGIGLIGLATWGYLALFDGNPATALLSTITVALSIWVMGLALSVIAENSQNFVRAGIGMVIMSLSIYLLGLSIASFYESTGASDTETLIKSVLSVSGSVVAIGLAFALIGNLAPKMILGGIAMSIASLSILILSASMMLWNKAEVTNETAKTLSLTILGLTAAMSALGLASVLVLPGAATLLAISVALLPLAFSLSIFKKLEWSESDSDLLTGTIKSMVTGFVDIFKELSFKDVTKALYGTFLLGSLGNSLSNFAQGLSAMANLQVPIYEVKNGEMVLKELKPLDPDFAAKLATSITTLTSALIEPMAKLGENEGLFFDGPVGNGIDLLGRLGNSLSNFAQGIDAFSKLQVPTYTVKNGELVLTGTKQLDPDFASKMASNIDMLVNALIEPVKKLGENEGLFFDGPVGDGVELLGELGNSLSNFAQGISAMANLQIPLYKVKDGKLVLVGTKPLDKGFAQKVGANINMMVNALIKPIKALGEEAGTIFDSDFEDGLQLLSKISKPINDLATGMSKFTDIIQKGVSGKQIATNITDIVNGLHNGFSKSSGYDPATGKHVRYFADTLGKIKENIDIPASDISSVAKSFDLIKKGINGTDLNKLTKFDSMFKSFAKLAESVRNNFQGTKELIEKISEMIDSINENGGLNINQTDNSNSGSFLFNSGYTPSPLLPQNQINNTIDTSAIVEELEKIKAQLSGTLQVELKKF